uniref:Uncharacterized protein n=1 Tax=Oryza meridionalis TaxID=40149 RepID=A0A0E0F3T4_9ORYZ
MTRPREVEEVVEAEVTKDGTEVKAKERASVAMVMVATAASTSDTVEEEVWLEPEPVPKEAHVQSRCRGGPQRARGARVSPKHAAKTYEGGASAAVLMVDKAKAKPSDNKPCNYKPS